MVHSIISKTECEVFLIDFGSKEIVSYEDIHEIPEGFLKPKAFVVNVYLDGFEDFNNSTEEWVKYFNEDTQKKDFLFHVKVYKNLEFFCFILIVNILFMNLETK